MHCFHLAAFGGESEKTEGEKTEGREDIKITLEQNSVAEGGYGEQNEVEV